MNTTAHQAQSGQAETRRSVRKVRRSLVLIGPALAATLMLPLGAAPAAQAVTAAAATTVDGDWFDEENKGVLTVKVNPITTTYGDPNYAYSLTVTGLVGNDVIDPLAWDGVHFRGPGLGADVGTYQAVLWGFPTQVDGYTVRLQPGTHTIVQAPLTVKADDKTMRYGDKSPAKTVTMTGLVNGDTPDDVQVAFWPGGLEGPGLEVGRYVHRIQSASSPNYKVTTEDGIVTVLPGRLSISGPRLQHVFGDPLPSYRPTVVGLAWWDDLNSLSPISVAGPSALPPVGNYALTPSGGTNPNYITYYRPGELTVVKRRVTVTPDNKTKVYGAPNPAYTVKVDNLPPGHGDHTVGQLTIAGPRVDASVGPQGIYVSGGGNPNYELIYRQGQLTVSPAPLTVTALDKSYASGQLPPAPSWRASGWVLGQSEAQLYPRPTCGITVGGAAPTAQTAPGRYTGAITCTGTKASNYAVSHVSGTLTVNPVLTLKATGLWADGSATALLDGKAVVLPQIDREVTYGSSHAYSFPGVAISGGELHTTLESGFSGKVTTNRTAVAEYLTMKEVVARAVADGGLVAEVGASLTEAWQPVETHALAGDQATARADLTAFAELVRSLTDERATNAARDKLVAHAQAVFGYVGGTGGL